MKNTINTLLVTSLFIFQAAWAGPNSGMSLEPSSYLVLKGTSTMHDYECKTTVIKGSVEMDAKRKNFTSIDVTIPVKSIHSESSSLDDNMYDALRADKNPEINFLVSHTDTLTVFSQALSDSAYKLQGILTVAGKEKSIDLNVSLSKKPNGNIVVKGIHKLLMTDFEVDPPTFMLGLLKTGNEITIEFSVELKDTKSSMTIITN